MATIADCAVHLDLTERAVFELIARGVIERQAGRGNYDLDAVRLAYIRHLRTVASGRKPAAAEGDDTAAGSTLDIERERYMKFRADRAEIDLAERRGELIPADQIADALTAAVTNIKQRLLAVPTMIAPQAAAERSAQEIEKLTRDAIHHALDEITQIEVAGGDTSKTNEARTRTRA